MRRSGVGSSGARLAVAAITMLTLVAVATPSWGAAAGALDKSYSQDGITKSHFYLDGDHMLIDAEGRVIVGGGLANSGEDHAVLVRYTAAGNLDPSFSGDGKMTLPGYGLVNDLAWLGSDILVLSRSTLFAVKPNGTLDLSYGGGDGEVALEGIAAAIAVSPSRRVYALVLGASSIDATVDAYSGESLIRSATVRFDGGWNDPSAEASDFSDLVLSADGSALYVAGAGQRPDVDPEDLTCRDMTIARLDATTLDPAWTPEVRHTSGVGCNSLPTSLAISPTNGNLTLVGQQFSSGDTPAGVWLHVARVTPDGAITMQTNIHGPHGKDAVSLAVAMEGTKPVIAGMSGDITFVVPPVFTIWRLTAAGALDRTFGGGKGWVSTPGAGAMASAVGLFKGKIVAAGNIYTVRYLS